MDEIIIYAGILSAVTVGIVQFIKKGTSIPNELMPLVSLVVGLLVGGLAYLTPELTAELSLYAHFIAGGLSGLAASGIYDIATKTKQGIDNAPGE